MRSLTRDSVLQQTVRASSPAMVYAAAGIAEHADVHVGDAQVGVVTTPVMVTRPISGSSARQRLRQHRLTEAVHCACVAHSRLKAVARSEQRVVVLGSIKKRSVRQTPTTDAEPSVRHSRGADRRAMLTGDAGDVSRVRCPDPGV